MSASAAPSAEIRRLPTVTPRQATAFQLARHHLLERTPATELSQVLRDINGAQAQLLPAAQLALWARLSALSRDNLEGAIWGRKSAVRAWCMRRTLHLIPSRDAALYGLGSARRAEKEIRWMLAHGASAEALEPALDELLEILDRPRSRSEIAQLLAHRLRVPIEARTGGTGWGNAQRTPWIRFGGVRIPVGYALHLAGARGVIGLGPARGAEATYVRVDAWTRAWRDLSRSEAELQLVRRYLHSFAPATPRDFAIWTGMTVGDAEELWSQVSADLTPVNVADRKAWVLRRDLSELASASFEGPSVRLLPHFDSFLLGHRDHGNVVGKVHHRRVYRPQGWVSPVLLVDGLVAGVWSTAVRNGALTLRVEPFVRLPRQVRSLLGQECSLLGRFLGQTRARVTASGT